ncbi:hypothetical protein ACP70R_004296 [Stipagrostis hirtigluma subsp. patula]
MAPPPRRPVLLILPLLLLAAAAAPAGADDLVAELQSLRARSPSGVIHLTDTSVTRFLSAPASRRPYSVLVFFDAASLHSKPDLHLPQLRTEFALLSASFLARNPGSGDLFFADIEFAESQHSFHQFGVNSLPHVRLVRPEHDRLAGSEQMDQSHFGRLADSMAEFIESRTGLEVGPIVRPPLLSRNQIILLAILFLLSVPFAMKRIIAGETLLHDRRVWMAGALFVYFFSVSGGMYGIIRHTPMFLTDRSDPDKLVFFYQGSGMQLGAEGFTVGFLYTLVGLMIAGVTHLLVKVESLQTQRFAMLAVMVIGWWAVRKVIFLDNWKTGYSIHTFWPSSWR